MFGHIKQDLLSKKYISEFITHFARGDNWHELDNKTGNLGYGWVHYALIRNLRPKRVLVIGSRYGFVPAVCALACKDNRKGIVDFVDVGYDYRNPKHKAHWGGVGFWTKVNPQGHFGKFGLDKYISSHIMTTKEFSKKYPRRKWEYINIDGDHSYEGVKFDFETFWPQLLNRGFISLHDIYSNDDKSLEYGVYRYWGELNKKYRNTIEIGSKYGLGLIQKA